MLKILKERILFGLKSCFCWLTATSHHLLKKTSVTLEHVLSSIWMWLYEQSQKNEASAYSPEKSLTSLSSVSLFILTLMFCLLTLQKQSYHCAVVFFGGRCAVCLQLGCLFVFEEAGEWYHKNTFRCFFLKTSVSKLVCYQCAFWNVRTLDKLFVEVNI